MFKSVPLNLLVLFALGCTNSDSSKSKSISDSSQIISQIPGQIKKSDTANDFQDIDPANFLMDYIKHYSDTTKMDSTFLIHGNRYFLHLRQYCLFDSGISVPVLYLEPYKLNRFVTHNFAADITLAKNDSVIIRKQITRDDFINEHTESNLAAFGAIDFGGAREFEDHIALHFSYSIPLTDVGVPISVDLYTNGKLKIQ
jgi:hypothetical protein